MHIALSIVAIAIVVLAVTALANRLRFSAPLLLIVAGVGASFIPTINLPRLSPEIILLGFLPPLLYAAAIRTSVIDFRANRRSIASLSVLLVVVTALGIGLITWLILPVSFAVAFTLGAVVAPPDAVAATTIARRVGLPRRLVTILEGESLVNDATAITCLRVGLVAIGGTVSAGGATLGFLIALVGGAAVGLALTFIVVPIRRRITQPAFDTAISMIVPFAAYLPAEEIHLGDYRGSGVIAVVVAGLALGHKSPVIQTGQSRLSERVNWATIQLLLENTVFFLIGLEVLRIVRAISVLRALRPADRRFLHRRLRRGDRHPAALGDRVPGVPLPSRPRSRRRTAAVVALADHRLGRDARSGHPRRRAGHPDRRTAV